MGWARIISSTSMAMRFLNIMLVGGLASQEMSVATPALLVLVELATTRPSWRTLAARHWPFWAMLATSSPGSTC